MSFKRYESGAWADIENVRRYSGGAWTDCESVKKYSGGAWIPVWESAPGFRFGWVYNAYENGNGEKPAYTYNIADDRNSCFCKLISKTSNNNSELILQAKVNLAAGSACNMQFQLSNVSKKSTGLWADTQIIINQSNNNGLWATVNSFSCYEGIKTYSWVIPDGGVTSINLVTQVYGTADDYVSYDLSDVIINGLHYIFK